MCSLLPRPAVLLGGGAYWHRGCGFVCGTVVSWSVVAMAMFGEGGHRFGPVVHVLLLQTVRTGPTAISVVEIWNDRGTPKLKSHYKHISNIVSHPKPRPLLVLRSHLVDIGPQRGAPLYSGPR